MNKRQSMQTAVLVIEDNPIDVQMIRHALQQEKNWHTSVSVENDGERAVHYLLHQGPYANSTRPDLLILDMNLPKRSGAEILRIIRTNEELSDLPVVILSSSPEDVVKEMVARSTFQADLYLTKPSSIKEYLALGKLVRECFEDLQKERFSSEEHL